MTVFHLCKWLAATCVLSIAPVLSASPLHARSSQTGVVPSLSGAPSVIGPGAYPRANFLHDGSIIGAYTAPDSGDKIITLARSTDSGTSWTEIGTAARGPTATTDIDNPYPLQLPSGRILVAYRNHDLQNGVFTFYRITISYSDDNGATWLYLSTPASDGPPNGLWEPFLRIAQDGSLQLYYSRENSGKDQDSLMRTSTDGGKTWSAATTISGAEFNDVRDGMIGVATISGSKLIAVFESEQNSSPFSIHSITSTDDGKTWGNRQTVYTPKGSGTNAAAPQVINVGGTLVVSFQTNEDTPTGNVAKIVTSGDGGVTWGHELTFSPDVSTWAGLMTLDDSSFLGLASHNGAEAQKVKLD
jgi:hypothetical protein